MQDMINSYLVNDWLLLTEIIFCWLSSMSKRRNTFLFCSVLCSLLDIISEYKFSLWRLSTLKNIKQHHGNMHWLPVCKWVLSFQTIYYTTYTHTELFVKMELELSFMSNFAWYTFLLPLCGMHRYQFLWWPWKYMCLSHRINVNSLMCGFLVISFKCFV